jgi:hypothetical protein
MATQETRLEIITRLKKTLIEKAEKLNKKPTHWNQKQYNRIKEMLHRWHNEYLECGGKNVL